MEQTLDINDNNFKMLFSSCLGNYYPIFIDALGRMKNGEKLEVPFLEEHITMIVEKVDDTHIRC